MPGYVRKFIPYDFCDIAYVERYLQEQAEEGLLLEGISGRVAKFRPSAPISIRYRLHPAKGEDGLRPSRRERALFMENGWEYISNFSNLYSIYAAADPAAPELHTEPITQAYAFRRVRNEAVCGLFVPMPLLAYQAFALYSLAKRWSVSQLRVFLGDYWLVLALFLLADIFIAALSWHKSLRMLKLYGKLKRGIPISQRDNGVGYRRAAYRSYLEIGCAFLLCLVLICMVIYLKSI